jgi:hypothetical protein
MKKAYSMLFAVALGVGACGDGDSSPLSSDIETDQNGEIGDLTLNLTGSDSDGRLYRLRNGEFYIFGYPDFPQPADGGFSGFETTVSTETDPDAPVITLRVVPGYYNVAFNTNSWYLERRVDDEWERVEQAVLLTPSSTGVYVSNGFVSQVNFRFGVDGELIDFRAGDLQIGIEIEQPGEGPGDAGFPPFPGLFGGIGGLIGGPGGATVGGTIGGFGGTVGGPFPPDADAGVAL